MNGAEGNVGVLRKAKDQYLAAGERAISAEFKIEFENYPELTILFKTTQLPEVKRQIIESYGEFGLLFKQHGTLMNSGQITATLCESIEGVAYKAFRKIVREKEYVNIRISLTPESKGGKAVDANVYKLESCLIGVDAGDLSKEDVTALYNANLTIDYNWFEIDETR